ncbi:uncharacterized protein BDZ99DRAFT_127686 [Mytilinidion resinicola]|uniref:Uncharacterized protein n=1 Tax=Mytilinidion resinicola TaxID=574789 RepID=A0A6A6Z4I4_9PEZI|nr:uncharacterized protein BDZ99DRAFT_127686 [Mytilinidion resinicola]KAF2816052.1 hypothetical protein BDZ99DRAFT_127686 [Mytilinidion resinicola]
MPLWRRIDVKAAATALQSWLVKGSRPQEDWLACPGVRCRAPPPTGCSMVNGSVAKLGVTEGRGFAICYLCMHAGEQSSVGVWSSRPCTKNQIEHARLPQSSRNR